LTAGRLDVVTPLAGGGAARVVAVQRKPLLLVPGGDLLAATSAARAVGGAVLALLCPSQLLEPLEHEAHGDLLQGLPSSARGEAHAVGDLVG